MKGVARLQIPFVSVACYEAPVSVAGSRFPLPGKNGDAVL